MYEHIILFLHNLWIESLILFNWIFRKGHKNELNSFPIEFCVCIYSVDI